MKLPHTIRRWTADEVAECLDYRSHLSRAESDILYTRLWDFCNDATNPTPTGGDGSEGVYGGKTVETPGERLDEANDDKVPHFWERLTTCQQEAISLAVDDLRI